MDDRPILILGAHKSGTTLLRSLLDGHPALFAVPIEAHFFRLLGRWVDYPFQRTPPTATDRNAFIRRAAQWVETSNRTDWAFSDSTATDLFDETRFRSELEELLPLGSDPAESPAGSFAAYMDALVAATRVADLGTNAPRVVEKSVENAEFAPQLARMFPNARFVHVIRHPYAVVSAFRRSRSDGGWPWIGKIYAALYSNFYHLERNRSVLSDYRVLRYEDLVRDPAARMRELSEQLEVEFRDSLLEPTLLGRPWSGNSSFQARFRGVSADAVDRWKQDIRPLEVAMVNRHLGHLLERFDYPRLEPRGSVYLPRAEKPKEYVANRLSLLTGWRA